MQPLIDTISDTARWAAAYRAMENDRPDPLFRDPLARRLAGALGEQIAGRLPEEMRLSWVVPVRTFLLDQLIAEQLRQGLDSVINLAAGLDARPYRLPLPAGLRWVEVDLPHVIQYKEDILRGEKPVCDLTRVASDLSRPAERRDLLRRLGDGAGRALVLTEGLLIYLSADEAASLAADLAAGPGFGSWLLDLQSPGLLRLLERQIGRRMSDGGAPLRFGPAEGAEFFRPYGWEVLASRPMLETAARAGRVPPAWGESAARAGPWRVDGTVYRLGRGGTPG